MRYDLDWSAVSEPLSAIALAAALGGILGFERELAGKPAGLRTHVLVCASAALLVLLALELIGDFREEALGSVRADPVRVIQAVVVGISFLGTGTILTQRDGQVEGLTTAASVLMTAAIGMTIAVERWLLAVCVTVGVVLVLAGLGALEKRLKS